MSSAKLKLSPKMRQRYLDALEETLGSRNISGVTPRFLNDTLTETMLNFDHAVLPAPPASQQICHSVDSDVCHIRHPPEYPESRHIVHSDPCRICHHDDLAHDRPIHHSTECWREQRRMCGLQPCYYHTRSILEAKIGALRAHNASKHYRSHRRPSLHHPTHKAAPSSSALLKPHLRDCWGAAHGLCSEQHHDWQSDVAREPARKGSRALQAYEHGKEFYRRAWEGWWYQGS